MFTYDDVYNKFCRQNAATRLKDATSFVQCLAQRQLETGLQYFVESDGDCRIDKVWVQCAGSHKVWGVGGAWENVLLFDPTFGINCYGMKLSMFVTVDKDGASKILAFLVHHSEDYEDVYFGLMAFHQVFETSPTTFFTDSGAGILKAVDKMTSIGRPWHKTEHLLCVYHIDQNFYTHIHPLFNSNSQGWHEVHNLFWRIAKSAGDDLQVTVNDLCNTLRHKIAQNGSGKTKQTALAWFDDVLMSRIEKWAGCFTWQYFSAGVHATQRSESMNAAVKAWVVANSNLSQLLQLCEWQPTLFSSRSTRGGRRG